jgi:transposase
MNNPRLHGERVRKLMAENNLEILVLAPYSPHKSHADGP